MLLPREPDDLGVWLAEAAAFDAAGADALWVDVVPRPACDPWTLTAALAALTYRSMIVMIMPDGRQEAVATLDRLCRGRLGRVEDHTDWVLTPVPEGRAAWRDALAAAAERGATGVRVPADPRLLDLLRNPEDPGDRADLQLAQG